jgi:DNA repair protein RadC
VVAPDVADIRVTRDLVRARQLLKIKVRHHVIVGREKPSYLSST